MKNVLKISVKLIIKRHRNLKASYSVVVSIEQVVIVCDGIMLMNEAS